MSEITYIKASAREIGPLLEELEDTLIGNKRSHCILACITMAIMIQNDKLSPEQVAAAVKDASEVISLHASQQEKGQTH